MVIRQSKFIFILFLVSFLLVQPSSAADWQYTMRPGDTLWTLCEHYSKEPGCWQKLGPLNNIDRDRQIPPGTRIRIPVDWLKVPAASVNIVFTQGDVRYQLPGEEEQAALIGVKLTMGAILKTGEGSVSLLFADGSSMVLEPYSHLELDTLSNFELNGMVDSTVRLNQGTVKTRVIKREPRSHFRTITPSAVAAVRGTEYRVNAVPNKPEKKQSASTRVEVYRGLVDVSADDVMYPVPASFGIVAKQGEVLQAPVKLLEKPIFINFDAQQTKVLDATGAIVASAFFEWQSVPQASEYQLSILASQQGKEHTEKLLKRYRLESTDVTLNELEAGCYQVSLRAVDSLGLEGLAAQQPFCLTQQVVPSVAHAVDETPDKPIWPALIPIGLFLLVIL